MAWMTPEHPGNTARAFCSCGCHSLDPTRSAGTQPSVALRLGCHRGCLLRPLSAWSRIDLVEISVALDQSQADLKRAEADRARLELELATLKDPTHLSRLPTNSNSAIRSKSYPSAPHSCFLSLNVKLSRSTLPVDWEDWPPPFLRIVARSSRVRPGHPCSREYTDGRPGGLISMGYLLLIGRASALMLLPDPALGRKGQAPVRANGES